MSMTPAEMREMAAKACDKVSDGDVECLNQAPDEIRRHYHTGGRDAAAICARIIRAIPIPDTTAADDALEKAREALIPFSWVFRHVDDRITGKPDMKSFARDAMELSVGAFRRAAYALEALAAIDAAKAKGGG